MDITTLKSWVAESLRVKDGIREKKSHKRKPFIGCLTRTQWFGSCVVCSVGYFYHYYHQPPQATPLSALVSIQQPSPITTLLSFSQKLPPLHTAHAQAHTFLLTLPAEVSRDALQMSENYKQALQDMELWSTSLTDECGSATDQFKHIYNEANKALVDGKKPRDVELQTLRSVRDATEASLPCLSSSWTRAVPLHQHDHRSHLHRRIVHQTSTNQTSANQTSITKTLSVNPITSLVETYSFFHLAVSALPDLLRNHTVSVHGPPQNFWKYLAWDAADFMSSSLHRISVMKKSGNDVDRKGIGRKNAKKCNSPLSLHADQLTQSNTLYTSLEIGHGTVIAVAEARSAVLMHKNLLLNCIGTLLVGVEEEQEEEVMEEQRETKTKPKGQTKGQKRQKEKENMKMRMTNGGGTRACQELGLFGYIDNGNGNGNDDGDEDGNRKGRAGDATTAAAAIVKKRILAVIVKGIEISC